MLITTVVVCGLTALCATHPPPKPSATATSPPRIHRLTARTITVAYSKRQLMDLWVRAGGSPAKAGLAADIALAESGGRQEAINRNTNSSIDRGLWQINSVHGAQSTFDPMANARAAVAISSGGRNFRPWVTYNTGAYKKFAGSPGGSAAPAPQMARGASSRSALSPGLGSLPFTTTDPQAEKRVALANYLQQADPGSSLLRLGVVSPYEQTTQTGRLPGVSSPSPSMPRASAGGITGKRSPLLELFWQGPGGINAKNGKLVPQGFVSGHTDHVHVAAGPKTVVALGKLAQRMGLHVGENPHFGGVNPVHAPDSYHYKGEAIDVSGDPAKERAFAHRVAGLYGIK